MRSRWSSPPCRARPTSWSPGAARRRRLYDARRIRRGGRLGRTGHRRPAGDRAAGDGAQRRAPGRAGRSRSLTDDAHGAARIEGIDGDGDPRRLRAEARSRSSPASRAFTSRSGRITTLGRGGSDTSAVALAAALGADRCDIYTDVDGVYTTDPRIVRRRAGSTGSSFEEMLEMASLGAKVLQVRSVELAMVHKVKLYVRSSFDDPADPQARHADLRRGGYRGAADRHRHRLFARRSADHPAQGRRQARRRGGDLHAARGGQHQRRHDHPGRLRRHGDDRHHLHRAGRRFRARQGDS